MNRTLKKHERVKSRKLIEAIFKSGNKVARYPLLLFYMPLDHCPPNTEGLLFGVSVSKKRIRKAVDRNKVKRRIREAYRLQKQLLLDIKPDNQPGIALFYVYIGNEIVDYAQIERSIGNINQQLGKKWSSNSES